MADWHWHLSTHSGKRKTWSCKKCKKCRICKIWPDFHGPLYSSSTETKAHSCSCIPASVIVRILNSSSKLQNQILSILSWNTPSDMPGGQINTMSCYWSYAFALAQMVMMILVCNHHVLYDQWVGWSKCKCDPGCCWTDKYTECPAEHCSEPHMWAVYEICTICTICWIRK